MAGSSSSSTTDTGVPALKEWAAIIHALVAGEQIIDLRKGGLREDGRHFAVKTTRLWLYPTYAHQRAELVKPAYRHWVDTTEPADQAITVAGWAEVAGVASVTDADTLAELDGRTIWTSAYAESRLAWKPRDPLWVLALRVHRLDEPITVAYRRDYGGCTSWVDLDGLPADPTTVPATPALSDVAFDARMQGLRDALGDALLDPG
ncbi:MAG TPA: DUF1802 family protein [Acidimicrobiia bacterium]|nr:DUF1802 family protein [Acidimicrobiia bacterium]